MNLTHQANGFNRRVSRRIRTQLDVCLVSSDGPVGKSRTLNLSSTGVRLWVERDVDQGQDLHLQLDLPNEEGVVACGRAVWQQSLGRFGSHIVGVAFEGPVPAIENWLRSA
jgi:PilZ domain-containing protein